MYRGPRTTLGFLVDESAPVSAEDIMIQMLRQDTATWGDGTNRHDPGNEHYWARTLVERGSIDLQSPSFLDQAFGESVQPLGLMLLSSLGLSPEARDSRGNTILHFAARRCSWMLARFLFDNGVDATLENTANQTALDIVRLRAAQSPAECRVTSGYFEDELAP